MSTSPDLQRELDDPLVPRSIEVLKSGQAPSGAFIASPSFTVYRYAWLRDGAFCAHALDVVGERDAAAAWHAWVVRSIEAHREMIESATRRVRDGETPPPETMPPARYTLDGNLEHPEDDDPWPNFQVDGYGMWLWSLESHLGAAGLPLELVASVELVAAYLAATWQLKCFNCWEEFDGGEHASTLGAVSAGLASAGRLLGNERWQHAAGAVRDELLSRYVHAGRFKRGAGDARLDGSLLWLGVPFGVLDRSHALVEGTVEGVRNELTGRDGGVYRFRGDTYFGGGEWLLLTSSLAWHDAVAGNDEAAAAAQAWVRAQALQNGDLPEQVTHDSQEPSMIEPWVRRWGAVATPLLWSHAMYLIAEAARAR
ncbi:MAG: glycoside hydrolase family 15 protein [Gaiellaceae bacterium]